LTNFEANAKQNEVKINNRFSKELPADADETMLRDRLKRFFLCYASNSIKSIFSEEVAALLGISIEDTKSNEFTNIFSGKNCYPIPSVFDELRRTSIWNWAGHRRRASYYPPEIENKEQVYTLQLKERV
jgi:hypothetical protein